MTAEKTVDFLTAQPFELAAKKYKLEWYYFLLYFGMFVFALMHIVQGLLCVVVTTSSVFDPQAKITLPYIAQALMSPTNEYTLGDLGTTVVVFIVNIVKAWGEPNVRLAVVFMLVSVLMGCLYIFNWSLLRKHKRLAPTMFLFLIAFSLGLIPYFFQMARMDINGTITPKYMLDFVVMGVAIALNKKYFDKRAELFKEDGLL